MESPGFLTSPGSLAGGVASGLCPRCGEPSGPLPPVEAAALGGRLVTRCPRCGTRSARSGSLSELLFTCESCGLPFGADRILPRAEQICPDCRAGSRPDDLPDARLRAAAEAEIRAALGGRWRFVSAPRLSDYLDRVAQQLAAQVEGAPGEVHVVLVDDDRMRTLALPSGTILVSLAAIAFLEDEAELAFLLAHEIAHAASLDAAVRLATIGFRAAAKGASLAGEDAWAGAAMDLLRLGYGRKRERDADLRALEALLTLRYDPTSVLCYLGRLGRAIERGMPAVAEIATAHPAIHDRIRRIEKALYGRVTDDLASRVNREVFRRAAGLGALAAPMSEVELPQTRSRDPEALGKPARSRARTILVLVAAAIALGSAGIFYYLLSR